MGNKDYACLCLFIGSGCCRSLACGTENWITLINSSRKTFATTQHGISDISLLSIRPALLTMSSHEKSSQHFICCLLSYHFCLMLYSFAEPCFHPTESIWAVMLDWRLIGKINRIALCCVVYDSCAQWYALRCEQFLIFFLFLSLEYLFLWFSLGFWFLYVFLLA